MKAVRLLFSVLFIGGGVSLWAGSELAPSVPDLSLPEETESVNVKSQPVAAKKTVRKVSAPKNSSAKKTAVKKTAVSKEEPAVVPTIPAVLPQPEAAKPAVAAEEAVQPTDTESVAPSAEEFVAGKETEPISENAPVKKENRVVFNPVTDRDPTLSPDDRLLLKHREEVRLRAIEAEKQRKLAEERRRLEELERQRQLELELLRDPSREIRGKIQINGIIGQEVFIGNKVYTVGKTVLGARIVQILPDSVVFMYKGQKFTKKVKLK